MITRVRTFLLALLIAGGFGCSGGGGGQLPPELPEYFSIEMVSEGYPGVARARIVIRGDGSGSYEKIVGEDGTGGDKVGQLELSPEDVMEVYNTVREVKFYSLKPEYIGDPPMGGRGVDIFTVEGGGPVKVVRSERTIVDALEKIADVLKSKVNLLSESDTTVIEDGAKMIGDRRSKIFYPTGHEAIEAIPEADRVEFESFYDALDASYNPAPDVEFPDR